MRIFSSGENFLVVKDTSVRQSLRGKPFVIDRGITRQTLLRDAKSARYVAGNASNSSQKWSYQSRVGVQRAHQCVGQLILRLAILIKDITRLHPLFLLRCRDHIWSRSLSIQSTDPAQQPGQILDEVCVFVFDIANRENNFVRDRNTCQSFA